MPFNKILQPCGTWASPAYRLYCRHARVPANRRDRVDPEGELVAWRRTMIDQSNKDDDSTFLGERLTTADRVGLFVVASILGTFAYWIFWIGQTFVGGKGWGDFAVRLILHDLVFSISCFSIGLAVYAASSPRWLDRILTAAARKLHSTIALVLVLFAITSVFYILILPLLLHFGLLT
jgi:hypothetical protein